MGVLITGVSGTGRSSIVGELRRRGYPAFDADDDGFTIPTPDGTWGWLAGPIRALLEQFGDQTVLSPAVPTRPPSPSTSRCS